MKTFRTILAAIACFLIAVGLFSVIGYELYFRHAEPVLSNEQVQPEEQQKSEPENNDSEPANEPADISSNTPSPEELRAKELIADLTLEQKILQLFFVTPESLTGVEAATRAGDATKEALLSNPVGGIIYSEKNLEDIDQVKDLLSGTQAFLSEGNQLPAFLAIDEEGGDVSPVSDALDTSSFNTMAEIGAASDENTAHDMGVTIAKDIKSLGFNVNFSPVADLAGNEVIDTRAFSKDAEIASKLVGNVIAGSQENGVLNVASHFPGLGSISDVAHIDRTRIEKSLEDMKAEDFLPFQNAIDSDVGFILVSHAIFTSVDDQRPCSMSSSVVSLLREDLGFNRIIITDSLNLPVITDHYNSGDAAVAAISAGADMLLCPSDLDEAIEALLNAIEKNTISEERIDESVIRILEAKICLGLIH